jgi:hypothetical protein
MVGEGKVGKPCSEQLDPRQTGIEIAVPQEFSCGPQGRGKPARRETIIGKNHGSTWLGYPEGLLNDLHSGYGTQEIIAKDRLKTLGSQGNFQSIPLKYRNIGVFPTTNTLPGVMQHLSAQIKTYNLPFGAHLPGKERQIKTGTAPKIQHSISGMKPQPFYCNLSVVPIHTKGKQVNHGIVVAGSAIIE